MMFTPVRRNVCSDAGVDTLKLGGQNPVKQNQTKNIRHDAQIVRDLFERNPQHGFQKKTT
jgi:hypothetical protein